jgi:hypothetical protein
MESAELLFRTILFQAKVLLLLKCLLGSTNLRASCQQFKMEEMGTQTELGTKATTIKLWRAHTTCLSHQGKIFLLRVWFH